VVTQALFSTAYTRHPYRRPVIGNEATVRKLTREKLLEFFSRWYVPANITLVVVGDFEARSALARIKKAWGSAGRVELRRAERTEPAQKQPRAVIVPRDVHETHLSMAFHVPDIKSEDTPALDVAAIILGQGDSSRLNISVRRNKQLVTDVYAYSYTPKDPGLLVVGASMPSTDPEPAVRAMLREIYRFTHEEASHEELAKARTIIESDAVYQKETVQGMARKLGFYETVAGGNDFEKEYLKRIHDLTPERLRAVCAHYLTASNLTLATLLPEAEAKRGDKRARLLTAGREEEVGASRRFAHAVLKPAKNEVVRHVLPNGLRILILRDTTVPIVAYRGVWVGGLRYEDARVNGINNLIATLITRGTTTRAGEEIVREVEGMAGSIGGFSGRNSFGVRAELLSKNWERGLEIVADCVNNPEFPAEELEKERRQILDELKAQEDNLSSVAFRLFSETLYRRHPYRLDALGTAASIGGLSRKMLNDYYTRHFPPGGMTIAVVGDADPNRVIEKVTGLFGDGAVAGQTPPRVVREDLLARPRGTIEVEKHLARQQAHMVVGFPGTTIDDPDRYPLEVMATILSGQGGRLFVELRDKRGLAYRVNAFSLEGIDPGYFAVYIACSPENLPAAIAGIRTELGRIVDEAVPAAELDRAKKYLVGTHEISLQRRAALASTLAFHESYGLGFDEYRRYSAGILAVDAGAVQRVAREYLAWDYAVIATVKPAEAASSTARQPKATRVRKSPAKAPPAPRRRRKKP
jgi:zinc protease